MSVTERADEMLTLRRDIAALRSALERATAERDYWRNRAQDVAFRHAAFIAAIRNTCKAFEQAPPRADTLTTLTE